VRKQKLAHLVQTTDIEDIDSLIIENQQRGRSRLAEDAQDALIKERKYKKKQGKMQRAQERNEKYKLIDLTMKGGDTNG